MNQKQRDEILISLSNKIDNLDASLNGRINELDIRLNGRIDNLETSLNGRIDGLEGRMDGLEKEVKMNGHILIRMEHDHGEKLAALFDAYLANSEQLESHNKRLYSSENRIENLEIRAAL